MPFLAFGNVVFADDELFGFHKLVNAHEAAGVFAGGAGFAAEAGRESGIENRQFVFGQNFVGAQRVENQFGSAGQV